MFSLKFLAEQESIGLPLSSDGEAEYIRWARVHVEVEGRGAELTIFRDPDSGELFLAFKDATARTGETYGAGPYLEVHQSDDGRLVLDFNYAYNPNCAYNHNSSCPLPPAENVVDVQIRAGERTFLA